MTGLPDKYASRVLLSVKEAADATGYSVDTIETLLAEGRLTVYRRGVRGKRMITAHSLLAEIGVPTSDAADTQNEAEGE